MLNGWGHSLSGAAAAAAAVAGLMPRDRSKCESFVICRSESESSPGRMCLDSEGEEE